MHNNDRMGVVHTTNLYATAVDTLQWALFDQVFTPDISIDFGGGAVWSGLEPLREAFAAIHAPFTATQHITTNHTVTIEGDRAHCFSYVLGRFIRDVGEGGNMFESGGWYDDTLVRDGQNWLIARRICRSIWVNGNPQVLATGPETGIPELFSPAAEAAAGRVETVRALLS
ncbi:nuclear transport factor 2 family protein [Haliea sp. E17]|uniref:nuclear transport factor 2 family protein n=1 Tax=Haliea sp. E17 TaxID=3401576 RepID=UPI003AAA93BC